jgi:hypothetical protein
MHLVFIDMSTDVVALLYNLGSAFLICTEARSERMQLRDAMRCVVDGTLES